MKRNLAGIAIALLLVAAAAPAWSVTGVETLNIHRLKLVAIQADGRLKPLDTFARESLRVITGEEGFGGQPSVKTVLDWYASPQKALAQKNIRIDNLAVKKQCGLARRQRWFSYDVLSQNKSLMAHGQQLSEKLGKGSGMGEHLKLSKTEKAYEQTLVAMHLLKAITDGSAWTVIPNPKGLKHSWAPLSDLYLGQPMNPRANRLKATIDELRASAAKGDAMGVADAARRMERELPTFGPYPARSNLAREVYYNAFHPFRKAWILYLIGFFLLLFAGSKRQPVLYWSGVAVATTGFVLHAYGFYLRCRIAGRPPVTNMYESVIWVAFGAVLFSLIFEFIHRSRVYLMASTAAASLFLIMADSLPAVLDPSIEPLTPVLRNNYWLTVHVLTITLGYAAFLLSLGLGHMSLWKYLTVPEREDQIKSINDAMYRAVQVGVLLLAAGTILGGVWADYSWGRFWSWDPKEVWALIALLGYLAILHGRFAGWLRDFGVAAWTVVAFLGVLMAWYGVNFVLGKGLHSYGFGTGGIQYVATFVALELAYVIFVTWRVKWRKAG